MTAYIVIFMLFFAVLAAGWFYWQRAKTRDAAQVADTGSAAAASPPAEAPASTDATASTSTDQQ